MVPGGGGTPTRGEPRRIGSLQQSHRSFNASTRYGYLQACESLQYCTPLHSIARGLEAQCYILCTAFCVQLFVDRVCGYRLLDESERGGFVTEKALRCAMVQKKWAGQ